MKRIVAIILALILVLSVFAVTLVSCNKEEEKKPTTTQQPAGGEPQEGDIFAERAAIPDGLPEKDFGGKVLRFAGHNYQEIIPKEEDMNKGYLVTDSRVARNETVKNRFNMDIKIAYTGTYQEVNEWISKTVLSGADEFDVMNNHSATAGSLVVKNLFINWYDVPNIDFSKPWWSPCNSDELTYDGKAILALSDLNSQTVAGTYCMFFNKALAQAYDLGNLYEVALDGKWTFDYFINLVKDIYQDTDGSGDRSDGDFYGFAQAQWYKCPIVSWQWAFDNPICKKDADGVPQLAIKTDKINEIVNAIYDMCYNTQGVHFKNSLSGQPQGGTLFLNKQCVFVIGTLGNATSDDYRDFEDDYGILPLPKWNEEQTNYYTMASGEHTALAVPKTAKDLEFIGTCVEALTAETWKQVTPTFYEIALKTRYLRDNESKEVLDIVLDGRVYDFGYIYGGSGTGFNYMMGDLMERQSNNFESYYSQRQAQVKLAIKNTLKAFDKLG